MISLAEWKLIGAILIGTYFISLIILGLINEFAMRLKNKSKKVKRQHINNRYAKIDLVDYLTANMAQEFIGQKKVIINQLVKM